MFGVCSAQSLVFSCKAFSSYYSRKVFFTDSVIDSNNHFPSSDDNHPDRHGLQVEAPKSGWCFFDRQSISFGSQTIKHGTGHVRKVFKNLGSSWIYGCHVLFEVNALTSVKTMKIHASNPPQSTIDPKDEDLNQSNAWKRHWIFGRAVESADLADKKLGCEAVPMETSIQ